MTHDVTMWCAWRFVGSSVRRSFAPILGHSRALRPNAEACLPCSQVLRGLVRARFARMLKPVCQAARFCAALCGIAELCSHAFQIMPLLLSRRCF